MEEMVCSPVCVRWCKYAPQREEIYAGVRSQQTGLRLRRQSDVSQL